MNDSSDIRRVLVVDDEADIRNILTSSVRDLNFECDEAENGLKALELLKKNTYHIVLCDIGMPEMNGLECLAKAQVENISTPFVFITGYDDQNRTLQAIRLGALDFISKPFDWDEVKEVLYRVIEIGIRRDFMYQHLKSTDPKVFEALMEGKKMVSLLRARNNKIRTG